MVITGKSFHLVMITNVLCNVPLSPCHLINYYIIVSCYFYNWLFKPAGSNEAVIELVEIAILAFFRSPLNDCSVAKTRAL